MRRGVSSAVNRDVCIFFKSANRIRESISHTKSYTADIIRDRESFAADIEGAVIFSDNRSCAGISSCRDGLISCRGDCACGNFNGGCVVADCYRIARSVDRVRRISSYCERRAVSGNRNVSKLVIDCKFGFGNGDCGKFFVVGVFS